MPGHLKFDGSRRLLHGHERSARARCVAAQAMERERAVLEKHRVRRVRLRERAGVDHDQGVRKVARDALDPRPMRVARNDDPRCRQMAMREPGGEAQRWESIKLTLNVIYFSLTGTYKKDAIHQPFIEMKLGS